MLKFEHLSFPSLTLWVVMTLLDLCRELFNEGSHRKYKSEVPIRNGTRPQIDLAAKKSRVQISSYLDLALMVF